MEVFIEVIVYGLSLLLGYLLMKKHGKELNLFFEQVVSEWPSIPNWSNWVLGILLVGSVIVLQKWFFFESLIVWILLVIIAPFFYLSINKFQIFSFLQVLTFFITIFYALALFFGIDNSRDVICESLIPNYSVYYTTEDVTVSDPGGGYTTEEREIAHVETGNNALDFMLERMFPYVFRIAIGLTILLSLKINISIRMKHQIIHDNKCDNEGF
jgi:hypothetical protein